MLALSLLAACARLPETVQLSGLVLDAPYGQGSPAEGVEVLARDQSFAETGTAVTGADGRFEMPVAAAQPLYLELSGEGRARTLFAGSSGIFDMDVSDGTLWVRAEGDPERLAEDFGDCAAAAGGGGIVEGEVRWYVEGVDPGALGIVETAQVRVYESDGTVHEACYLDEDGVADPEATVTGPTGRFAVFGLPPGPLTVEATYLLDMQDEVGAWWTYRVYMVEDAVAPFYPLLVELLD